MSWSQCSRNNKYLNHERDLKTIRERATDHSERPHIYTNVLSLPSTVFMAVDMVDKQVVLAD